jgi:hypothetical protein
MRGHLQLNHYIDCRTNPNRSPETPEDEDLLGILLKVE